MAKLYEVVVGWMTSPVTVQPPAEVLLYAALIASTIPVLPPGREVEVSESLVVLPSCASLKVISSFPVILTSLPDALVVILRLFGLVISPPPTDTSPDVARLSSTLSVVSVVYVIAHSNLR